MGDFPLMTENGTFIINGAERVVVSQLIRSPGVYFTVEEDRITGRELCMAKLIPNRGAWLEFETAKRDMLSVKVDRKRKLPVTILLRAVGFGTDEELLELFEQVGHHARPSLHPGHHRARSDQDARTRPCSSSTKSCGLATRPPWTMPRAFWSRCSSPRAATTWAGWGATS